MTKVNVQPASGYPIEKTGPSARPTRSAESTTEKDFHLMQESDGTVTQVNQPNPEAIQGIQSSAPPANPEAAVEEASYKQRYGEVVNRMGEIQRQHKQDMARIHLMNQMNQATDRVPQAPQQQQGPQLPGVDMDGPATVGDLIGALDRVLPQMQNNIQAQVIRSSWNITPEEEAEVMKEYPALNTMAEPARSHFIKEAVDLSKANRSPEPAPVNAPQGSPQALQQRQMAPTVPSPEFVRQPAVAEATPEVSVVDQARAAYDKAKKGLDYTRSNVERKELLAQMKDAANIISTAIGYGEEAQRNTRLTQKT